MRRGEDFFVPTGTSVLQTGDQLLVITDHDADAAYRLLTDEAEEEAQWRAEVRQHARQRVATIVSWLEGQRAKAAERAKERIEKNKKDKSQITNDK